jgi:hypothetical protein
MDNGDDESCGDQVLTIAEMASDILDAYQEHNYQLVVDLWFDYSDDLVAAVVDGELTSVEMAQMHEEFHGMIAQKLANAQRALEIGLEVIK